MHSKVTFIQQLQFLGTSLINGDTFRLLNSALVCERDNLIKHVIIIPRLH